MAAGRRKMDVMMFGLRSVGAGQGGVEAHVDHLVQELDKLGISTLVATRSTYDSERWTRGQATKFIPIWAPRSQSWEALIHSVLASCYALVHRPSIVHVHAIGPSLVIPMLRLGGLKVVTTHHGEDYNREKWGKGAAMALRLGEYFQARFANGRICVSQSLAKRLSKKFGKPFSYIPNGVPIVNAPPGTDELARFGLEPAQYIVTVSRLVPEKRHLDLIAAFKSLNRPELQLAIVGGADHVTPYSEGLTQAAKTTPNVVMTGFLTGEALRQLIGNAAVFALPSTHEGLPIALLEAMSFQRHVVVSDIEPNRDIGLPADNYHRVGDVSDLGRVLTLALSRASSEPVKDWTSLLEMFDWADVAQKSMNVYQRVSGGLVPSGVDPGEAPT